MPHDPLRRLCWNLKVSWPLRLVCVVGQAPNFAFALTAKKFLASDKKVLLTPKHTHLTPFQSFIATLAPLTLCPPPLLSLPPPLSLLASSVSPQPSLDLSCVAHMINAAEPVDGPSLDAFTSTFAPFGLPPNVVVPTYGLAEHTVFVCSGGTTRLTF